MDRACLLTDARETTGVAGRLTRRAHDRTRALVVAIVLAAGAAGVAGCGSDDSKPKAPAVSVAKTAVEVADTKRGAIGYRSVGSGRPLVLVMGFGSSMEDWEPTFVDTLAKHRRVIIFDNAGIGKSAAISSKLTISGMAEQTAALIDALKLGSSDVLGWSMGGMIAQALTVRHADKVHRLVLSATQPGNGESKEIPEAAAKAIANASPEEFLALLYPEDQKAALKFYTDGIAKYTDRSTVPDDIYGPQRKAINSWLHGDEPEGAKVTEATLPTLAADGKEDNFNPASNTELLAKLFPNAELQLYDDAGHAFLFQPDTNYADRVDKFLSEDG